MKLKTLVLPACGALVALATTATVQAGPAPLVIEETPIAPPPPMFGGNVSVGYDSHYIFRGVNYGEDSVWTSVEWSLPFTPDFVDLTIGAWYQNPITGVPLNPADEDELDLYATATVEVGPGISLWVGYAAYTYPEAGGGSTNEVGTGVEASIFEILTVAVNGYYDWDIDGFYFDAGVSHYAACTDFFGVEVGASIGYQSDYNNAGDDWNDVRVYLSMPIALTDNAELAPYIAHSWALDAIDDFQQDELYGGVSLSVSF